MAKFSEDTLSLLTPMTGKGLKFVSALTGEVVDATDDDTLLVSESTTADQLTDVKYANTILTTAYEKTNPKILNPCPECKRQIVRFQRLGDDKKVIYVCVCGHKW